MGRRGLRHLADHRLKSFAAGYPEPQDLLLSDTALIDEDGNLLLDERRAGRPPDRRA